MLLSTKKIMNCWFEFKGASSESAL